MTHLVRIEYPDPVDVYENANFKEARLWLVDNATGGYDWFPMTSGGRSQDYRHFADFYFQSADDALLFKLTWGGK